MKVLSYSFLILLLCAAIGVVASTEHNIRSRIKKDGKKLKKSSDVKSKKDYRKAKRNDFKKYGKIQPLINLLNNVRVQ